MTRGNGVDEFPSADVENVRGNIDELCVNSIRVLAIDAVRKADSGHPGMPMGMAPAAYVLWTRHLTALRAIPNLTLVQPA